MMIVRILTALSLALLATACAPAPEAGETRPAPNVRKACLDAIYQLNSYRVHQGLQPLHEHTGLHSLCLEHSMWLRQKRGTSMTHGSNVSHSGSQYRERVARIQHNMEAWGENVAYISNTPDNIGRHLIVMWIGSPPHHEAMLGDWTHVGVGITADEDGAIFAVMNFGRYNPDSAGN